jgi:glycosyltransferase involved in cell wall biosynthesis
VTIKRTIKQVINSNKASKKLAHQAKKYLREISADHHDREIYDLNKYYPTIRDYYAQQKDILKTDPLISILLPTYNTPEEYLRECIESIMVQSYPNWELCIADDNSSDKKVVTIIKEYQARDDRIKLVERKSNGHISEATNSALDIAKGEFIGLMDHDDVLWPNALYEVIKTIRSNKKVDFIYTDEDKIDGSGKVHSYPFLKPDFSPEFLESCNYITHFSCVRTTLVKEIKGLRKGYEGAQDWDLFIRLSEVTKNIIHIPKILYSWRVHEASTASNTDAKPYVYEAQKKLLNDHVQRSKKNGTVETGIIKQHRTIKYEPEARSSLTVVISYSTLELTTRLLKSLSQHEPGTSYDIVIETQSNLAPGIEQQIKAAIQGVPCVFKDEKNSIESIKGSSTLCIDDKVIISSDSWAKTMLAETQIKGVGFVFPVILDITGKTIKSAGIGLGYGKLGATDMLSSHSFDDVHYTRGLYAKSRRNVSAGNRMVFAALTEYIQAKEFNHDQFIESCTDLLDKGYRHIYTPYVQVRTEKKLEETDFKIKKQDVYLNRNFKTTNGSMEVA